MLETWSFAEVTQFSKATLQLFLMNECTSGWKNLSRFTASIEWTQTFNVFNIISSPSNNSLLRFKCFASSQTVQASFCYFFRVFLLLLLFIRLCGLTSNSGNIQWKNIYLANQWRLSFMFWFLSSLIKIIKLHSDNTSRHNWLFACDSFEFHFILFVYLFFVYFVMATRKT